MSYKIIYDSITRCKGRVITFIHDFKSEKFIDFVLEDLKSEYKIVDFSDIDFDSLQKLVEENPTFRVRIDEESVFDFGLLEDNSVIVINTLRIKNNILNHFVEIPTDISRIKIQQIIDRLIRNIASRVKDKNIIIVILRNYYQTSNTMVYGQDVYVSDTVFLLKNNELSFLKKRSVDYLTDKFNINQLLRNIKLKMINKS